MYIDPVLEKVEVKQLVVVDTSGRYSHHSMYKRATVIKVTKIQITVKIKDSKETMRFSKSNGTQIGDDAMLVIKSNLQGCNAHLMTWQELEKYENRINQEKEARARINMRARS